MAVVPINLAVEDELSELVLRRLLGASGVDYHVGVVNRRGGFGYLRSRVSGWNRAAAGVPFLVLTDLDNAPCPPALLADWLPEGPHPNLMFRVAVREVEAWLIADRLALARFLRCRPRDVPPDPEALPRAK
jgi:hypothetical protein